MFVSRAGAQDPNPAAIQMQGKGAVVSIVVHDPAGGPISSMASVKLLRGTIPSGQAETTHGRVEILVSDLGEYTVIVQAAG